MDYLEELENFKNLIQLKNFKELKKIIKKNLCFYVPPNDFIKEFYFPIKFINNEIIFFLLNQNLCSFSYKILNLISENIDLKKNFLINLKMKKIINLAAERNSLRMLKFGIYHKFDINDKSVEIAIKNNSYKILKFLIKNNFLTNTSLLNSCTKIKSKKLKNINF